MNLNSIEQILEQLEQQPGWEQLRAYRQLLQIWQQVVDQKTAQHTQPMYIRQQVLWVAVSSAVRGQELTFQRRALLKRLNQKSTCLLKDIRFSAASWHELTKHQPNDPPLFPTSKLHKNHQVTKPSLSIGEPPPTETLSAVVKAKNSLQQLLKGIEANSSSLPACPQCNSVTPEAELARWNCCYLCAAQRWSS